MKACTACKAEKPMDQFYNSSRSRDGKIGQCKACVDVVQKAKRARNPEKEREQRREWNRRNPGKVREMCRSWEKRNPEKAKLNAHPQKIIQELPNKGALPRWANRRSIEAIYAECRRITVETGILHHVDHVVPLRSPVVSGLHCEANLQIITAAENIAKANLYWPDQ